MQNSKEIIMKKLFLIIPIILLFFAGCTFTPAETIPIINDLEANTTALNVMHMTDVDPNDGTNLWDQDADESGIQHTIYITFDKYFASGVVSFTNFELTEENNAAGIEDETIEYQKEFNRVKIFATFDDDGAYMIRIMADNVVGENGDFLDGNGNGIEDGSPFDDILIEYTTGIGVTDNDYEHPKLWMFGPIWQEPTTSDFRLFFDKTMDSASVVNHVNLYNEDGSSVPNDTLISIDASHSTYIFLIDDVDDLSMFYVEIECENIVDSFGNVMVPYNEEYTTDEPENFVFWFMTEDNDPAEDDTPLHVNNVIVNPDYVEIFFDDTLDITTMTNSNIFVYYMSGGEAYYIPGDIILSDDTEGCLYSLVNYDKVSRELMIIVKKETKDDAGWMLDNNGNDIGGEEYDPNKWMFTDSDDYIEYQWY